MDYNESKAEIQSENTHLDSSPNQNIPARLRRLKIQQNILQKELYHLYAKLLEDDAHLMCIGNDLLCSYDNDATYFNEIKKKFTEIKNLYKEIRFLADEANKGKCLDVDEIRKNILLLESKIKEYKKYLQFQLETLQKDEIALNEHKVLNKKVKVIIPTLNTAIVPSPVKVLIESPLKCMEVQQFQEFMKRTKRFGGWNEFNHNKFVQIWNTHYSNADLDNFHEFDINSETCMKLTMELLEKIMGTNREDIVSHIEWYIQYLRLYMCQKNALNKWKENRDKIKRHKKAMYQNENRGKPTEHSKVKFGNGCQRNESKCSEDSLFSDLPSTGEKSCDDEITGIEKTQTPHKSKLMEPTKQWLNRCNDQNEARVPHNIETVEKLNIPFWRIGLNN